MNTSAINFSTEQRRIAVQRLTALWAFAESGLGGILHALQAPFTGLIVGGMAVLLITLIAFFSQPNYKTLLHSVLIVLIIKAMVSPYTPFPAYIAVTFQALSGYLLFSLFRINLFSILLLATIAMIESAIQKLLILTLFFGNSFWKAADSLMDFIAKQFGVSSLNGSYWIISIYLLIYFIGGICIAFIAYKTIKEVFTEKELPALDPPFTNIIIIPERKKRNMKFWGVTLLLLIISSLLFLFAADEHQGWLSVLKTIIWTSSAILLWYFFISPLFTQFIQKLLKKKQSRYSEEISNALSLVPAMKQLTYIAWGKSNKYNGSRRLRYFCSMMVYWSIAGPDAGPASKKEI